MTEFEFQIDELLNKLDVISGSVPPTGYGRLAALNGAGFPSASNAHSSSSGADVKESSGSNSKSGASSERRHPQHPSFGVENRRFAGFDDRLIYDSAADWNQLIDFGNFEAGLNANDDDKVS